MIWGIIAGLIGIALIAIIFVVFARKHKEMYQIPVEKLETLFMKDLIAHFKTPSVMASLKAKKEYIAVAIREPAAGGRQYCTVCIFDEKKERIVMAVKKWDAANFDQDLTEAFGDKPMIILQ